MTKVVQPLAEVFVIIPPTSPIELIDIGRESFALSIIKYQVARKIRLLRR